MLTTHGKYIFYLLGVLLIIGGALQIIDASIGTTIVKSRPIYTLAIDLIMIISGVVLFFIPNQRHVSVAVDPTIAGASAGLRVGGSLLGYAFSYYQDKAIVSSQRLLTAVLYLASRIVHGDMKDFDDEKIIWIDEETYTKTELKKKLLSSGIPEDELLEYIQNNYKRTIWYAAKDVGRHALPIIDSLGRSWNKGKYKKGAETFSAPLQPPTIMITDKIQEVLTGVKLSEKAGGSESGLLYKELLAGLAKDLKNHEENEQDG